MSKKILVIDDSATMRELIRGALEQGGFVVTEAVDGQDALQKMSSEFQGVVCDVHMPRMDGVQFVQEIKKRHEHASIPILMLTTEGSPKLIEKAKLAGARGWMVKPFKPQQLVAAMQRLTEPR
jgi:two-component system chemotaxis response regulator CheY